jgi:hypothetical protein
MNWRKRVDSGREEHENEPKKRKKKNDNGSRRKRCDAMSLMLNYLRVSLSLL